MGPRFKLFLPLFLFALLAMFLFRGLFLDPTEMPSALIDRPLPTFSLPALGGDRQLSRDDVTGEVALLNVWATWCVSCLTARARWEWIWGSTAPLRPTCSTPVV